MPALRPSAITIHQRTPLEQRFQARSALAHGGAQALRRPRPVVPFKVDRQARPPVRKQERLLEADWRFRRAWERADRTARAMSPAAHERTLALEAAHAGWSDQEITDLLVAARRKHGQLLAAAPATEPGEDAGLKDSIGRQLAWTHEQVAREQALREVSAEFAGVFMGQFMRAMRKTVPVPREGFGFGGREEETFREMLDDEFATRISRGGNYGMTALIYRSLARADGMAAAGSPRPAAVAATYRAAAGSASAMEERR